MHDPDSVCMLPWCQRGKAAGDAMCATCWDALPSIMRSDYWATTPYSSERRYGLLKLFRWAMSNMKPGGPRHV